MARFPHPPRATAPTKSSSGTFRKAAPPPPQAGVDYPRSAAEFHELYATEAACRTTLERLRWPSGYGCRTCGSRQTPFRSGRLLGCTCCGYLAAITCDTLFHGTAKPLRLWFRALWEMVGQPYGTSAEGLRRLLQLRDQRCSRELLIRVQRAMASAVSEPLRGPVEVARTTVEVPPDVALRTVRLAPVVVAIAVERSAGGLGRARLRVLETDGARAITDFVADAVQPPSRVHTGSWHGYSALECAGFDHVPPNLSGHGPPPELPHAQRVGEALRKWLWMTRGISRTRLEPAISEFAFRYQYRACPRGLTFYHLLRQAVPVERIPPPAPVRQVHEASGG